MKLAFLMKAIPSNSPTPASTKYTNYLNIIRMIYSLFDARVQSVGNMLKCKIGLHKKQVPKTRQDMHWHTTKANAYSSSGHEVTSTMRDPSRPSSHKIDLCAA